MLFDKDLFEIPNGEVDKGIVFFKKNLVGLQVQTYLPKDCVCMGDGISHVRMIRFEILRFQHMPAEYTNDHDQLSHSC